MVEHTGSFIFLQPVEERAFTASGREFCENARPQFFKHTFAAGEPVAFPAAADAFFNTALAVVAPIPVFTPVVSAARTGFVLTADAAGEAAVSQTLFSDHDKYLLTEVL
jgi:hypothetical protein